MEVRLEQAKLILASASPRRRELLARLDLPFAVVPSMAEENAAGDCFERVKALAKLKCDEVFARLPRYPVLAADTLVCVDEEILGKPTDEADAKRMLRLLSGRWHDVLTGICLRTPDGQIRQCVERTSVHFCDMNEAMIDWYVRTGEPMDKAGAYGIQERAGAFVDSISGSPSNVIGLPLCTVGKMLREASL